MPETIETMKRTCLGLGTSTKRTCRRECLVGKDSVVPWSELVVLSEPYITECKRDRPPFPVESLFRVHFI